MSKLKLGLRGLGPTLILPPCDCPTFDWGSLDMTEVVLGGLHIGTGLSQPKGGVLSWEWD